ncbi:MAG: DUF3551 domain-containing protein [Bradyrhizobium sp.]
MELLDNRAAGTPRVAAPLSYGSHVDSTGIVMRILAAAMLALVTILAARPASAQTYDPGYPVCLHVYGPVGYLACRYSSIPQCRASASGLPAQCEINPYFAAARTGKPAARRRRHHGPYSRR